VFLTYQKVFINLVVASYFQVQPPPSVSSDVPSLYASLSPTCFFNTEGGKYCTTEVVVEQLASAFVCIEMGFVFSFAFQEAFSLEWLHLKTAMATSKKKRK